MKTYTETKDGKSITGEGQTIPKNPKGLYGKILREVDKGVSEIVEYAVYMDYVEPVSPEIQEAERISKLEIEAQAYQDSIMSANHSSTLLGAKASRGKLGIRAKRNLEWLSAVWAIYDAKVASADSKQEFIDAGEKPFSFKQVMAEFNL